MSDEKTLGQVYFDAAYPADKWLGVSKIRQQEYDLLGAGIAAVCRAVMAERDKSTEFALRAMQIPRVIAAARQEMEREPAKPVSPTSGTINTGPIIACDVKQEQPEAGDWAMGAANWVVTLYETTGIVTSSEIASRIREAAERHYSRLGSVEHSKRLADRLDTMEKERDAQPSPSADATGEDELRKAVESVLHGYSVYGPTDFLSPKVLAAIQPRFDAVLAERDEAIKAVECHKSYHDTEQAIKRAEAAEDERDKFAAELQELQEAVIALPPMSLRHTTTGTPYWTYTGAELTHPNKLSAILAAYRATKGKEPTDAK